MSERPFMMAVNGSVFYHSSEMTPLKMASHAHTQELSHEFWWEDFREVPNIPWVFASVNRYSANREPTSLTHAVLHWLAGLWSPQHPPIVLTPAKKSFPLVMEQTITPLDIITMWKVLREIVGLISRLLIVSPVRSQGSVDFETQKCILGTRPEM